MGWTFIRTIIIAYVLLIVVLWVFQRRLIYFPTTAGQAQLRAMAHDLGLEPWVLSDGTLSGWSSPGAGHRWIIFHGNAGFAMHRAGFVTFIRAVDPSAAVYLFEYPGYGARPGPPSESKIAAAAEAAVKDLAAKSGDGIVLLGESIGASFAAAIAQRFGDRVKGILLITPFDRLSNVASHHYPFLPVRWLLRERHEVTTGLAGFGGRAAVVVAENDSVVPRKLGEALYGGLSCEKRLWVVPGADHNSIPYKASAGWWREAVGFVRDH